MKYFLIALSLLACSVLSAFPKTTSETYELFTSSSGQKSLYTLGRGEFKFFQVTSKHGVYLKGYCSGYCSPNICQFLVGGILLKDGDFEIVGNPRFGIVMDGSDDVIMADMWEKLPSETGSNFIFTFLDERCIVILIPENYTVKGIWRKFID